MNTKELCNQVFKILDLLNFEFIHPPLIVGGMALEYYGIRKSGPDFDCMVSPEDWVRLKKLYPNNINLFGGNTEQDVDATINVKDFDTHIDLLSTLYQYNYYFLGKNSILINSENSSYKKIKIISIENLYFVKSLCYINGNEPKCESDTKLIINYIIKKQYKNFNRYIKKEAQ